MRRTVLLTVAAAVLLAAPMALAYDLTCYLATDDHDGDGYAAGSSSQLITDLAREDRLTCPAGYVPGKNDADDNDPNVHPRKLEKQYNGKDDNCNGLVDEPQYKYESGIGGITSSSFRIYVKINDQATVDNRSNLYADIEYARLSAPLVRYRTAKEKVTLTRSDDGRYYATLTLTELAETTVYMARVQFYKKTMLLKPYAPAPLLIDPLTGRETFRLDRIPVLSEPDLEIGGRVIFPFPDRGENKPQPPRRVLPRRPRRGGRRMAPRTGPPPIPGGFGGTSPPGNKAQLKPSDRIRELAPWRVRSGLAPRRANFPATKISYEALGDPSDWYYDTTTGPKQKSVVRTHIVHKALMQFGDSEAGRVGILGYQRINGKRYCGNDYDYWCSEFYAYCAKSWLSGISSATCVSDLVSYFSGAYYSEAEVAQADRGDYVSFGDYHSGMFLALDKRGSNNMSDWYIWTCEGNTSDSRRFNDTGTYVRHVPGNTVQVEYRPLTDATFGFGHILYAHLK